VYFNGNFNISKQINCALVGLIKDCITSECTVQLEKKKRLLQYFLCSALLCVNVDYNLVCCVSSCLNSEFAVS